MTEASYTAWDDKQYVWPPPDGWYEASDGKWWPQGYGPPETSTEPEQAESTATAADRQTENGWQIDSFGDRATDGERVVDVGAEAAGSGLSGAAGLDVSSQSLSGPENRGLDGGSDLGDRLDRQLPPLDFNQGTVEDQITDTIPAIGGPIDGESATVADAPAGFEHQEDEGEEDRQASIRAANEAFGTGLMPPMADRPASLDESLPPIGDVSAPPDTGDVSAPLDTGDVSAPLDTGDVSGALDTAEGPASLDPLEDPTQPDRRSQAGPRQIDLDGDAFTGPDQETVTGLRGVADQQAMLVSPEKGSSRGLMFAILGVVALVAAGAAVYFAIGGDGEAESTEGAVTATGPGSINEPHPRATGVVVYYPDGGVEQRWIVEVLEPVRDATSEIGQADGGLAFAATRIRITNESGNDGASVGDLRFNLVDGTNTVVVRTENTCPALADELDFNASVAIETSIEGGVCWAIPADDLADLKLGIESSKVQGRVHILLQ